MHKFLFLFCFISILLACNYESKDEKESRIIYELTAFQSDYILNYFGKRFDNDQRSRDNYNLNKQYSEIRFYGIEGEYYIITFDENDDFSEDYVSRTNRFLKLSKENYIPIIFYEDKLLSNKERKLSRKVGGGKAFRINLDGSIEMITQM